jgi:hypothetical protein
VKMNRHQRRKAKALGYDEFPSGLVVRALPPVKGPGYKKGWRKPRARRSQSLRIELKTSS